MPTKVPTEFVGQYVATRDGFTFTKDGQEIPVPAKLSILVTNVEGTGGAELFEVPVTPLDVANIKYDHLKPMDWIHVRGVAVLPDRGEDRPGRLSIFKLAIVDAPGTVSSAPAAKTA